MDGIDISNAPTSLIDATKAAILRCWDANGSLEDAILDAATEAYDNAIDCGCDNDKAERLGMFVGAVGAHMRANIQPYEM